MPQSQHSKSVRAFLRVRGLDSCLACSIIKFESVFSHCLLSNPRISCGGVFWWILVRPICLGERGGMWHKGKWWKNNDENSADEFLTKLKSTRFQGTTWHNNPFLYSLRLTLATYHCVVSGGVGEIPRSTSLRLKQVNTSAPFSPSHIDNQLGKPSGGWSKFLDPNTAKEYWWHDSGRPPCSVGGDGS